MRAFDLVHVHGESIVAPLLEMRGLSARVIFTPHWYASSPAHLRHLAQGRFHRFDQRLLAHADRVVCVSESEALYVRRHAPNALVDVVPNGVDSESIVHARPFALEPRVVLTIDDLTHWAGIHRLISALPALAPSYRLVVAGRGRGRGTLEAHADYLGVADRVSFIGSVNDKVLGRWLRTSSVVASLKEESLWADTPLTAAYAGAPVLASDISANHEAAVLIGNDGIGFVSRQASPFVIADALRKLDCSGVRPAGQLVPTWYETAQATISIYREIVADGHRTPENTYVSRPLPADSCR
jgi:glycosyltransferase involved in cell wall biosynthesis